MCDLKAPVVNGDSTINYMCCNKVRIIVWVLLSLYVKCLVSSVELAFLLMLSMWVPHLRSEEIVMPK